MAAPALATAVRERGIGPFPRLPAWCPDLPLLPFQQTGVAWLYAVGRGVLADQVGLGKMIQALGLLALLKLEARGAPVRALVLCEKTTQRQWCEQAARFAPGLRLVAVAGEPVDRRRLLRQTADALVVTYPLLLRDEALVAGRPYDVVICDEASLLRNHRTKTAKAVRRLTRDVPRVVLLDATPVQTSLLDLRALLDDLLHLRLFGSIATFLRRHCVVEWHLVYRRGGLPPLRMPKVVAYQRLGEFRERVAPYLLRRRAEEVLAELPATRTVDRWLELPPAQRRHHEEARRGVVTLLREGQRRQAQAHLHHVVMACDTTAAFGDPLESAVSVKLDRLLADLQGDLVEEKVVVFSRYKVTIAHAEQRFRAAGVGYRRFTADESADEREAALHAFRTDPSVQVLIGTTALERGLNLQTAGFFIALDQLWNPQRMVQLFGRIRRLGSLHATVTLVSYRCTDTIEERMARVLSERAAVADAVLEETTELWAALSDEQLDFLLREGTAATAFPADGWQKGKR